MEIVEIIHKPLITEKMNAKAETLNQFCFIVDKRANKIQIAKAIEELYEVTVVSVNTMIYAPKRKSQIRNGRRVDGKTKALKRAIVTLAEGEHIDFYSNI